MDATGLVRLVPVEPRLMARLTIVAPRGQAPWRRSLLDATDLAASHQSTGTSPAVRVMLPNRARLYRCGPSAENLLLALNRLFPGDSPRIASCLACCCWLLSLAAGGGAKPLQGFVAATIGPVRAVCRQDIRRQHFVVIPAQEESIERRVAAGRELVTATAEARPLLRAEE